MTITIKRTSATGEVTEGHLLVNGVTVCDTLENTLHRIHAGRFPVSLIDCRQYGRKMICVGNEKQHPCERCKAKREVYANTPMPAYCPMIKPGNGVVNRRDGSIIVGQLACKGCIIKPLSAFNSLFGRIRKNIERGNSVVLEIENEC